jgi:hypothetical protein
MNVSQLVLLVLLVILAIALALVVRAKRRTRAEVHGGRDPARESREPQEPVAVKWPAEAACLPEALVADCLAAVQAMPGFGPVTPAERVRLAEVAVGLNRKYVAADGAPAPQVSGAALVAMRTMEAAVTAAACGVKAQRVGDKLLAGHRAGAPVLELARRYRLPPTAVLRQILIELGRSAPEVRALLREPALLRRDPATSALAAQTDAVFAADLGSRVNADRIRAGAAAFEDAVGAWLRARGVEFKTEAELRTDEAPPTLTPDFLLTRPALVRGRRIHWIDAKAYPMYGSRLVTKGLAQQAQKYTAAFGPGAFVFADGVMCRARVLPADPLLLDGTHCHRKDTSS